MNVGFYFLNLNTYMKAEIKLGQPSEIPFHQLQKQNFYQLVSF